MFIYLLNCVCASLCGKKEDKSWLEGRRYLFKYWKIKGLDGGMARFELGIGQTKRQPVDGNHQEAFSHFRIIF